MKKKVQRILLILLMAGAIAYSVYNYRIGNSDRNTLIVIMAFMGFLILGQGAALIREWGDED